MAGIAINDQTLEPAPDPSALVPIANPDGGGGYVGRSSTISQIMAAASAYWIADVSRVYFVDPDPAREAAAFADLPTALAAAVTAGDVVVYVGDHSLPVGTYDVNAGVTLYGFMGGEITGPGSLQVRAGARAIGVVGNVQVLVAGNATFQFMRGCHLVPAAGVDVVIENSTLQGEGITSALQVSTGIVTAYNCQFFSETGGGGFEPVLAVGWNANNVFSHCHFGINTSGDSFRNNTGGAITNAKFYNCSFLGPIVGSLSFEVGNYSNTVDGVTVPARTFPARLPLDTFPEPGGVANANQTFTGSANGRIYGGIRCVDAATQAADASIWFASPVIPEQQNPNTDPFLRLVVSTKGTGNIGIAVDWASVDPTFGSADNFDTIALNNEGNTTIPIVAGMVDEPQMIDVALNAGALNAGDLLYGRVVLVDAINTMTADYFITKIEVIWQ